jgi:DNA modification methylase
VKKADSTKLRSKKRAKAPQIEKTGESFVMESAASIESEVGERSKIAIQRQKLGYNPHYEGVPLTDFASITTDTPLSSLNLNWREKDLPERLRTKHVHRLHPYLGKFIPQMAEIFLRKFAPSRVCDPFMGSGTTLVEANALGIASIGCDVSPFNCLISKVKTDSYDTDLLAKEVRDILAKSRIEEKGSLLQNVQEEMPLKPTEYLSSWFAEKALRQLLTYLYHIPNYKYQDVLKVILSRAARSARLVPHHQLDVNDRPQTEPYQCRKHFRICQPTDDASKFLQRYSFDTITRIKEFDRIRTSAQVKILCGDSRQLILQKHDLVFTSPPYVGLIDYHEQHRYAYELLSLLPNAFESVGWWWDDPRANEPLEIGPASQGVSNGAKTAYIEGIADVFRNVRRSLHPKGACVIVAGDRRGLYPEIAKKAGFRQEEVIERHVNRRTGRRTTDFFEQIMVWRRDD